MYKFKEGERVLIRKDLERKFYYMDDCESRYIATSYMIKYKGKIAIIKSLKKGGYRLQGLDCIWTDDMLVKIDNIETIKRLK